MAKWSRAVRWCAAVGVLAALVTPQRAAAETEAGRSTIGFSNLVARLDNDEIGVAKAEVKVHILETLREAGFAAVGAESLVFDRDDSNRADFLLGGTVREVYCLTVSAQTNCRIGIDWEVLDRGRDEVVYRVRARHVESAVDRKDSAVVGRKLVLGALRSLMRRQHFMALLNEKTEVADDAQALSSASFRSCAAADRQLPSQFSEASAATALIKGTRGFGSGFVISPDGLLLTAAHVVEGAGELQVRLGGQNDSVGAKVLRISRQHDVALLSIEKPAAGDAPCLMLQTTPPVAGTDVYAIGSPASEELAFSLSRGIVSGLRRVQSVPLIQTDASLSPGNSGGPLLDGQARVLGVVSRKIAGEAVEGLGFGVEIEAALAALKLQPGAATSGDLLRSVPALKSAPEKSVFNDAEDPMPSLDPEGDRKREEAADLQEREEARRKATPWYVPAMRWGGLALGGVGAIGIIRTGTGRDNMTYPEYQEDRFWNDLSWVALVVGATSFVVSYPLEPPLPESSEARRRGRVWTVSAGPGKVNLGLKFQ